MPDLIIEGKRVRELGFDKLPDLHRFFKYIASTIFRKFFVL